MSSPPTSHYCSPHSSDYGKAWSLAKLLQKSKIEASQDISFFSEKLILSVADKFYKEGYQEAGYEYIIIDDCWSEKKRDRNGRLVPDRERFPHGMKYIADYVCLLIYYIYV